VAILNLTDRKVFAAKQFNIAYFKSSDQYLFLAVALPIKNQEPPFAKFALHDKAKLIRLVK
jgi:hypothetical protein